jgi:hypothetical protein
MVLGQNDHYKEISACIVSGRLLEPFQLIAPLHLLKDLISQSPTANEARPPVMVPNTINPLRRHLDCMAMYPSTQSWREKVAGHLNEQKGWQEPESIDQPITKSSSGMLPSLICANQRGQVLLSHPSESEFHPLVTSFLPGHFRSQCRIACSYLEIYDFQPCQA